jgi:hypothetical protein
LAWYDPDWLYRQKITIDHTLVAEDGIRPPGLLETTENLGEGAALSLRVSGSGSTAPSWRCDAALRMTGLGVAELDHGMISIRRKAWSLSYEPEPRRLSRAGLRREIGSAYACSPFPKAMSVMRLRSSA